MSPVALVTGSSRGIGKSIALALAANNFRVIVHGRTPSSLLDAVVDEIIDNEGVAEKVTFDFRDIVKEPQIVDQIFEKFGEVHCLVNNAGISVKSRGDLLDVAEDSFDDQYLVNMKGTFFLTQSIAKRMVSQEKDQFHSIINITSSNAISASVERGEYCMSKSALSMMSKLFSLRLAEEAINVYEIRPGLIETDMTKVAKPRYDSRISKGFSPINRWGLPADVSSAVVPIATGAFGFSTGDVFHIDGGLTLRHY